MLPRAELIVKGVEPYREQSAGKAFIESSPDGSRPGIYYANLHDMDAMPPRPLYWYFTRDYRAIICNADKAELANA